MQPKLIEPGHGRVFNRCRKGLAPVLYVLLERGPWGFAAGVRGGTSQCLSLTARGSGSSTGAGEGGL